MNSKKRSLQQIVEEQVKKWQIQQQEPKVHEEKYHTITISREPGSGGGIIAGALSEELGYDLFHQEIIHKMAESTKMNSMLLESLDEKGLSALEDLISSIIYDRYLWPDKYLKHLMRVVGTIGKHGRAVIVGRGANFILESEYIIKVRIVAPLKDRIVNVSKTYDCSEDEAKRHVVKTESDRRAFIRKYFHAEVSDPVHYDLVLNSRALGIYGAVNAIVNTVRHGSSSI